MSSINLRRFSKTDVLKKIDSKYLYQFLAKYSEYFTSRGMCILKASDNFGTYYDLLSEILMTPDERTPAELSEALYYINEMCTPEAFDLIQDTIAGTEIDDIIKTNVSPADLVLQVWLIKPNLIERLHAQQFMFKPRAFEYFKSSSANTDSFKEATPETIKNLEADLNEWFSRKRRGKNCKVHIFNKSDMIWFLVRHGEPYTRESVIQDGESISLYYQPEKYDVLIYNRQTGEIRMHARSKGEKELYRTRFGYHFFGNSEFFDSRGKFTLKPLRENGQDSLLCSDITGMEWAKLKELQIYYGGTQKEIEIRKAEDLFASLQERDRTIPQSGHLLKAGFLIKFCDSKTPRTIIINAGNKAQFKRDDDAEILEDWMMQRGFITVSDGVEDAG